MTTKKIGLIGFFGWGNYGDELFLRLWKDRFAGAFEAEQINTLQKQPYFDRPSTEVAEDYDAFVIGGGDLVIPSKISTLYWDRAWLTKPVYIAGVGVPTWITHENPNVVRKLAAFFQHPNVRYISARDEESAAWIREKLQPAVPVRVAPDLVFSMDMPPARDYGRPVLGVAVRQRRNNTDDYSQLTGLVEAARERGMGVVALVLGTDGTGDADAAVAESLPFEVDEVVRSEDIDGISSALGGLAALASMKFHGTVVASMYGVPSIVLSPTSKSRNLYRLMGREQLLSHLNDPKMAEKLPLTELRVPQLLIDELHRRSSTELDALFDLIQREQDPAAYFRRTGARAVEVARPVAARVAHGIDWRARKLVRKVRRRLRK